MDKRYWDTNLFLVFLQNTSQEQDKVDIVTALLKQAESGEMLIVTSTLALAEIRPLTPNYPS